jgi:hypothetical protein
VTQYVIDSSNSNLSGPLIKKSYIRFHVNVVKNILVKYFLKNIYKNETIQAVNKVQIDVTKLTDHVAALREDLNSANKKVGELEIKNFELNQKMDELEYQIRKCNIIVLGLTEFEGGNKPMDDLQKFVKISLNVNIERNDISQVYRMGIVFGKRPLFVSFAKYGAKVDVMKNVSKLKGTSVSISDDLTKPARVKKKFIIGCSNQAKEAGHQVKIRNGS